MARRFIKTAPNSPVPDPGARRKPRRIGLYAPFVLLLLAMVGWSVFWFWVSGEAGRRMDAAAAQMRTAGYEVSWRDRTINGYPFRLNVTLTDARVRDPSGWALATPRLEAEAFLHGLTHWVFATPDGLSFTRPVSGAVEVKGRLMHASLGDLGKRPPSFSFEGAGLTFAPAPGAQPFALAAAEHVEFHLRPGPDDQGAALFKLEGGQARRPGLFAGVANGKSISMIWDSLFTKASGFKGASWAQGARAWSQNGGTIQVRQAGLTAGDAILGAQSGALSLDAEGRLDGALEVSLRGAQPALAAMAANGSIPPESALAATAVALANQAPDGAAHVALTFQAGRATLGPVAVAPAPKVF